MASITRSVWQVVRCLDRSRGAICRRQLLWHTPRITSSFRHSSDSSLAWEPDTDVKPEIPEYPTLNIRMRGYDHVVLETYAKYVHKLTGHFNLEATSWAVPARTGEVQTLKPQSTQIESKYKLAEYERTLQVECLPSTVAPILFETMQHNLPQGTWFTVKEPDQEEVEFRYVPDLVLEDLKDKIGDLEKAREDRRR